MLVGGPGYGVEGRPFTWDLSSGPVQYRTDGGPLSRRPDGTVVIDNAAGIARVQAMFKVWQDVSTASISYANAGSIQSTGSFTDGDVSIVAEFNDVLGSCVAGTQSPIIFDADGTIFSQLIGDPNVIGFAGTCKLDPATGRIVSGGSALNGRFQDGINDPTTYPPNFELTANEFDAAFIHEFGHFSGLDHSQINVNCLNPCGADDLEGLPTMFPFLVGAQMKTLAPDDIAWISQLYPETVNSPPAQVPFNTRYGTLSGTIFFSDGVTHAQGVNVVVRQIDNLGTPQNESRRIAVSVVSGYLFTGNPGQSVTCTNPADPTTCNNSGGSKFGSRDALKIGIYDVPLPAGTYTVEVESIDAGFAGASSVGPLSPAIPSPGPHEFWNTSDSATDDPTLSGNVTVTSGGTVSGIDIILNGTPPRFDGFESAQLLPRSPVYLWLRKQRAADEILVG